MAKNNKIRITVVGDGDIGKTCMLIVYKDRKFDERYIPTVFDMYSMTIPINNENYTVILQDTAGQEEFDKLRQLAYKDTDVFIICYSVTSRDSYENVKHTWAPEIKMCCPKAKLVLAATKNDLEPVVTRKEGVQLQKTIKAHDFIENSAKLGKNIDETIRLALRAVVGESRGQNIMRNKEKMACLIL